MAGHNTDVEGIQATFKGRFPGPLIPGRARHGLSSHAYQRLSIHVVNRTKAHVATMRLTPAPVIGHSFDEIDALLGSIDLLVHCLPPQCLDWVRALPFELLPGNCLFFDLNYGVSADPLRARIEALNTEYVDGLEMLIHQGVAAFRLWTYHARYSVCGDIVENAVSRVSID